MAKFQKGHDNQAWRSVPEGPEQVICVVVEVATGRTVTQATGRRTRKQTAQARSRENALRALKRKRGRRFVLKTHDGNDIYRLDYRYGSVTIS